jgi:hypothetical protein
MATYPRLVTLGCTQRATANANTKAPLAEQCHAHIAMWLYNERCKLLSTVQLMIQRICAPDYELSPAHARKHCIPLYRRSIAIEYDGSWSPSASLEYLLWEGRFPADMGKNTVLDVMALVQAPPHLVEWVSAQCTDEGQIKRTVQLLTPETPRMAAVVAPAAALAQLPIQTWTYDDTVLGIFHMTVELPI